LLRKLSKKDHYQNYTVFEGVKFTRVFKASINFKNPFSAFKSDTFKRPFTTGTLNKVMLIGHLGDQVKMHYFDDKN